MFCEKISVAVKAMKVITRVVKKGARTVSGASAGAVAMSSPLSPRDGPTRPRRPGRGGWRRHLCGDEPLGPGLDLTEAGQHPGDLRPPPGRKEADPQDEVPAGRHGEGFLS